MKLPPAARNPVSLLGIAIATAMAWVFLALFALSLLGYLDNPYIGLVLFVAIPVAFVIGLLVIPIGIRRERRRAPGVVPDWPVLDLRDPHQRSVTITVLTLTFVNVLIVSIAAYGGVHYMETTAFCGTVCHTTMEPEYVAHQRGPHGTPPRWTAMIGRTSIISAVKRSADLTTKLLFRSVRWQLTLRGPVAGGALEQI